MSRTKINVSAVIDAYGQISSAKTYVSSAKSSFTQTKNGIDSKIKNRANIGNRLDIVQSQLSNIDSKIGRIRSTVQSSANQYRSTDDKVESWRKDLKNNVGVGSAGALTSGWASYFKNDNISKVEDNAFVDGLQEKNIANFRLTDAQKEAILKALREKNKEAAMAALGLSGLKSEEEEKLIDALWEDLKNGFKDNITDNVKSGLVEEGLESGGNWIAQVVAGRINIHNAIAKGPSTANSFVIIDPNVASKTATMAKNVSTGLKIGIPIVGGIIDFAGMKMKGEGTGDALIKATAHVGIGLAGGKAGAAIGAAIGSVIPGAGTAVGGAIGFVAGVAITTIGNAVFDTIYDNREAIGEAISDTWNAATDWVEEKGKQVGKMVDTAVDKAKGWLSDVGDALSSGWKSLGSVFG